VHFLLILLILAVLFPVAMRALIGLIGWVIIAAALLSVAAVNFQL
jgi:hypothetical protein